ncbi:MAG: PhzF family phenazine biosynthesis protein [Christensenellales bacterium]|jgi:PhzF family phenazine biosynthesis protein
MKYFVMDVFTDRLFAGNPAGVCLPQEPLDAGTMQKIAFENNLAETAFVFKRDDGYDLRWFTPEVEVDLCGHATLASAYVLMNYVDASMQSVDFHTKSGPLYVSRHEDIYTMDFPRREPARCDAPSCLEEALGQKVLETHLSRDLLVLVESEEAVREMIPDFQLLKTIEDAFAVIVTAPGKDYDFVSRFFAPNAGVDEDHVTGSSHSTLIPFWSRRLHKDKMVSAQLSRRGGTLFCQDTGTRVKIGGRAVCYLAGEIFL